MMPPLRKTKNTDEDLSIIAEDLSNAVVDLTNHDGVLTFTGTKHLFHRHLPTLLKAPLYNTVTGLMTATSRKKSNKIWQYPLFFVPLQPKSLKY